MPSSGWAPPATASIPDGSILRLARIIGLGRAKELTLLNDHVAPEAALAMGLVNWVVPAADVDAKLAEIVDKAFHASRTATGHAKRLLHASFHTDPRDMIEEVMRAQQDCMDVVGDRGGQPRVGRREEGRPLLSAAGLAPGRREGLFDQGGRGLARPRVDLAHDGDHRRR